METPRESGGMQNKVYSEPHPLMMEVVPEDKRLSRAELVAIGNGCFTGLAAVGGESHAALV